MRLSRTLKLAMVTFPMLTACESSEHKAQRLRQDALALCLGPDMAREGKYTSTPEQDAKCDAARREYNKFTAGR